MCINLHFTASCLLGGTIAKLNILEFHSAERPKRFSGSWIFTSLQLDVTSGLCCFFTSWSAVSLHQKDYVSRTIEKNRTYSPNCYHGFLLQIIDGVRDEMIQLYTKFCSRNPSFLEKNGKVSIVAHSLGSVIAYDILTLWDIELRHLSQDATGSTGFLTESLQYLRSVTSRTGHEKMEAEGTQKENLRIKLAEARSEVMRLEAMVVSEVEHGKHEAGKSSSECPLAMPFKVSDGFAVIQTSIALFTLKLFAHSCS